MTDPIRPTDDEARHLARDLMATARYAALAVLDDTGAPMTTRVAFGLDETGAPLSFVSTLSQHTQALLRDPRASLLVGEPGPRGDPLTHPRLTIQASAQLIAPGETGYAALQDGWLATHPKARLYIGFSDFRFARFTIDTGFLNGGFGKAFVLTRTDLAPTP